MGPSDSLDNAGRNPAIIGEVAPSAQTSDANPPQEVLVLEANLLPQGTQRDTWSIVRARLEAEVDAKDFSTWVRTLCCQIRGNSAFIGAPNRYAIQWIEENLLVRLHELLSHELGINDVALSLHIASREELEQLARKSTSPERRGVRGRASDSVVEQAQLDLFQLERRGQFTAVSINPQNEFPTLLTRLPIFVPGRAKKQRELLDKDNALPFETSWGTGRKFGPPLTVYDEDTLMALGRLRQNMLIGDPGKMPYPVSKLYAQSDDPDVHVHVVLCMLSDIQSMCGSSTGGRNNKLRLDSIRRLAGTKIEFNKETQDKVKFTGTTIDLVHVKWDVYEDNAVLYIQFSPVMAQWLENAYTYIDWNVRRKLRTDVGKAVHRFLSGQSKKYVIYTKKLQNTIGHVGPYKHFMADLRETLEQLQHENWLSEFDISGNGRKQPHKLNIVR